jgi:hypothetical protein
MRGLPQLRAALALKSHAGLAPFCTRYGLIFRNSRRRISRLTNKRIPVTKAGALIPLLTRARFICRYSSEIPSKSTVLR